MTLDAQLRWLRQEQRTRERIIAEGHHSGFSAEAQADARVGLAVVLALMETLKGRQLNLFHGEPTL